MKMREQVIKLLKDNWMSNFQLCQEVHSESAGRTARDIRKNPPIGFKVVSRPKKVKGYNPCLEFRLIEVEDEQISK